MNFERWWKWVKWVSPNVDIEEENRSLQLDSAGNLKWVCLYPFFFIFFFGFFLGLCLVSWLVVFVLILNLSGLCFHSNLAEDNGVVNPEEPKAEEVEKTDRMEEGWYGCTSKFDFVSLLFYFCLKVDFVYGSTLCLYTLYNISLLLNLSWQILC